VRKLLGKFAYTYSSLVNIRSGIKGSDYLHEYIVINYGPGPN